MVKVLVGQFGVEMEFSGFWAEFGGAEISSYKDERKEKNITYTLYKCTAYQFEAYRVHLADETDPQAPVYQLHPWNQEDQYNEPYRKEDLAIYYPLFLKDLDYFATRHIDPERRPWQR